MVILTKIVKGFIAKLSGNSKNAQVAAFEEFAGDQRKGQVMGPCNEDFSPPDRSFALSMQAGRGRGLLFLNGYYNPFITPVAKRGERRLYSTGADGSSVRTEVFLKQDGTLLIANAAGVNITLTPAGVLNITAPGNINFNALKTVFNCPVDLLGNTAITGTFTVNGVDIGENHAHDGVEPGGGTSGGVV